MSSIKDYFKASGTDERPSKRVKTRQITDSSEEYKKDQSKATQKPSANSTSNSSAQQDEHEDELSGHASNNDSLIELIEKTGDIFNAPSNTLIIHACNCEGSWGAGIAKAFKDHYPKAFKAYKAHCDEHGHDLLGTAQLIPPSEDSSKRKHFVGCLYTSRRYGRGKDKPGAILNATRAAMVELNEAVTKWNTEHDDEEKVGEVRICKINSGLFNVPWEKTYDALRHCGSADLDIKTMKVVERE